jgi:hypothetical protein
MSIKQSTLQKESSLVQVRLDDFIYLAYLEHDFRFVLVQGPGSEDR